MVNQSLLTGRGIHRNAAVEFLQDNEHDIAKLHQSIGVTTGNERLFNRGKLDGFKQLLEEQGL